MKHLLLFIFTSLFMTASSQQKAIEYGFLAGTNLTTAYGSGVNKDYKSSQTGLSSGGTIKINTGKNWGLKTGLFYEQNQWAYRFLTFENGTGTGTAPGGATFTSNYLNLPVLADYTFGNKIKYYFDGGVFLGLLLSNHTATQIIQSGTTTETNAASNLNKISFGIALGAGLEIPLAPRIKLDIGLRDQAGLTNRSPGSVIKLNSIAVLAGLAFNLK